MSQDSFDWRQLFKHGESPYFAMFRSGFMGVPLDLAVGECDRKGIPIRQKDIEAWRDGDFKRSLNSKGDSVLNPVLRSPRNVALITSGTVGFDDFELYPEGWAGSERRWFPCSEDNRPLQRWGYKDGFVPTLYTREQAIALSPTGWVGQNMYGQPMVVFDIDGVGHGGMDEKVIEFGNRFKNHTQCWEYWAKPGSFHLYFRTNRIVPISHFPYAKLDLMGNETNAAVYTKNKVSNGLPMAELTKDIWEELMAYVRARKEERDRA